MEDLFKQSEADYRAQRKAEKLRLKIKQRTSELDIHTEHTETGHFYVFKGQKYPSVTGRLKLLKDEALTNWRVNRVVSQALLAIETLKPEELTRERLVTIMEQAKLAPELEFRGAGDIGRRVHDFREKYFARLIAGEDTPPAIPSQDLSEVISGARAVIRFKQETNYLPIACELYVADEKLEIGGTADDIGILNGKITFLDLKTSNIGDKDSYYYQVALYVSMFEKLYRIRTQDWQILHVSKTDGSYKLIPIPDIRTRIKEARKIVEVDKFLEALKAQKRKQVMIV